MVLVWGFMTMALVAAAGMWSGAVEAFTEATPGYGAVQRAFLREDFQTAAALAQAFVTDHPNVPETSRVWVWLALSLDRVQRSNDALQALDDLKRRLESNDPLWAEVLYWEGEVSRRAYQMVRARLAFQRLLERSPDSSWAPLAQFGMGLIYLHQQAFDSALVRFHEVTAQAAGTPMALDAHLFEGLCDLRLGHFKEAVDILQPLLEELRDPAATAQATFYLGESLTGLERYEAAVSMYQRSLAAAPASSQWPRLALFGLGWAYYRASRCEDSVASFQQYLAQGISDHRTEALYAKGSCLVQLGKAEEALPVFQQIVAQDPDHPLAFESGLVVADAYRREGKLSLAKGMLHTLLRRPLDELARARVQIQLGAIAIDQGNVAQARTIFQLAAAGGEPSVRQAALNGLGDLEIHLGHLTEAQRFYEEAIRLSERSALAGYAMYQVGRIHLQLGSPKEAVVIFQQLIERATPDLVDDARLALALAYLHQHERDLARAQLERIREQQGSPVAARAAYYEALLALGEGRDAEAERLAQETVAGAPRSEEATDAQLLLADFLARRTSVHDARDWLSRVYYSPELAPRDRAKLAKRLGDFARQESVYTEAIAWYDIAAQLLPSLQDETTYRIASCYEDAGDYDTAIRWYQMIDEAPWRVRGQLTVAKLFERQDRLDAAETIYERLANEPVPEAKIGQERLAALRGQAGKEGAH